MYASSTEYCRFLPRLVVVGRDAKVIGVYVEVGGEHGELLYTEVPRRILSAGFRILESTTACGTRIHRGFYVVEAGDLDRSMLLNALRGLEGVLKVETTVPWGGILVAPRSDLLSFGNMRAVMICKDSLVSIWEGYLERLGEGLAATLLFWLGYFFGRCLARQVELIVANPSELEPETLQAILSRLLRATGWADSARVSKKRGEITVRIHGNMECLALAEARHKPRGSNIMRGIVAGVFSTLYGTPVSVEEKSCVLFGGDFCEFRLTPRRS